MQLPSIQSTDPGPGSWSALLHQPAALTWRFLRVRQAADATGKRRGGPTRDATGPGRGRLDLNTVPEPDSRGRPVIKKGSCFSFGMYSLHFKLNQLKLFLNLIKFIENNTKFCITRCI